MVTAADARGDDWPRNAACSNLNLKRYRWAMQGSRATLLPALLDDMVRPL
jgi:hypothetical protein